MKERKRGYRYKALDAAGQISEGVCQASDRKELAALLAQRRLTLIHGQVLQKTHLKGEWFFESLHHLLEQKITLRDALSILVETAPTAARWSLQMVLQELQEGKAFSEALAECTSFPPFVICCLQQAEASGTLTLTCRHVGQFFQTQNQLQSLRRHALVYPSLLAVALWFVFTILLVTFVPQLKEFFSDAEATLGFGQRLLFGLSEKILKHPYLYVGLSLSLVGGLGKISREIFWTRLRRSRRRTFVPEAERLLWMTAVALLLQSHVHLLQALTLTEQMASSVSLRECLQRMIGHVRQGRPFHEALHLFPGLPTSFMIFAELGEKSGSLGKLLEQGASLATRLYTEKNKRKLALLTPLSLCLAGGFLIWLVFTLFQPFYQTIVNLE